ncbi:MAG: hypothetical protein IKS01_00570 [Paludibacteraceae bacterium]|nr:hypothetical protein [Paludibacteraceae bacterium]
MIVQEHFLVGEKDFIRTYSDKNMMIHGGSPEGDYSEACDPAELGRTYTETDIPIEGGTEESDKAEAFDILVGGEP